MGKDAPRATPIRKFLVGRNDKDSPAPSMCPWARTMLGWCTRLESVVIRQQRCKRWACPHCGPRRTASLAIDIAAAKPNRMLTLTVDPALWNDPRAAWEGTRRHIPTLMRTIRQWNIVCDHCRVLELTKRGWPHYHCLLRTDYIPQAVVRDRWKELTGAKIVDIRLIYERTNVFKYVSKYLSKQLYIPWTSRRMSASRQFFKRRPPAPPDAVDVAVWEWQGDHPSVHLANKHSGDEAWLIGRDTVVFRDPVLAGIEDEPRLCPADWE